jgi:GT2 family glycosyltransferase
MSRLHLLLPAHRRGDKFLGPYWKGGDHLDVDWVPGAALIVRREVVEVAGLLSEDVLMYGEDSEWCWRIRKAGFRIGLCRQVRFFHEEGQCTLRTWGDEERTLRMWRGIYDAYRLMRGSLYARALMLLNSLSFTIEAIHPTRPRDHRAASMKMVCCHFKLMAGL